MLTKPNKTDLASPLVIALPASILDGYESRVGALCRAKSLIEGIWKFRLGFK